MNRFLGEPTREHPTYVVLPIWKPGCCNRDQPDCQALALGLIDWHGKTNCSLLNSKCMFASERIKGIRGRKTSDPLQCKSTKSNAITYVRTLQPSSWPCARYLCSIILQRVRWCSSEERISSGFHMLTVWQTREPGAIFLAHHHGTTCQFVAPGTAKCHHSAHIVEELWVLQVIVGERRAAAQRTWADGVQYIILYSIYAYIHTTLYEYTQTSQPYIIYTYISMHTYIYIYAGSSTGTSLL